VITCQRFCSLITEEREGALSFTERAAFHLHRTVCGACRCYEEGLDRTVELLQEEPPEAEKAPEGMRAALLARMRAGKGGG
jgi:hypothetical protein